MKTILLASTMLLLASSWGMAQPQCPNASLSYYDSSLPNGCTWVPAGPNASYGVWSDFSSPMTTNPALIEVEPSCYVNGDPYDVQTCGLLLTGGTVSNIPSLNFNLAGASIPGAAFFVNLCGGPSGGTAEGVLSFDGTVEFSAWVTARPNQFVSNGDWTLGDGDGNFETYAEITSGSGTVSYFYGVGPEPGTMTLLLLGGGLTIWVYRRRKVGRA